MPLLLNDSDVKALMSMNDCVDVMEDAFNQAGDGKFACPEVFIT